MLTPWTVKDVIANLPRTERSPLPAPPYTHKAGGLRVALAVESMKDNTTDEGFQIMLGLRSAGYTLAGHNITTEHPRTNSVWHGMTHTGGILEFLDPSVVLVQDKREWEGLTSGPGHDPRERFLDTERLKHHDSVFKLTVLKDAHQNPQYHRKAADEIGCHAWVVYYHPEIVHHLAPYTRPRHLIRTYHTVDRDLVPPYTISGRSGCLLSGAVSSAYPLRERLVRDLSSLPEVTYLKHPGYHRNGCYTPEFLKILSYFKVSICTASMYGYALRKIMESTACGCVVVTDLPCDDVLPEIDRNLVRVRPDVTAREVAEIIDRECRDYDPQRQRHYAEAALKEYDYRTQGSYLAAEIDLLRQNYV